ncbi:dienelactone hydrolase family protein [Asticcacaulis excentricus]|uniref:Carboxymethylenebutenolidase n=1 Tax=Asticcacaulis excentricus (strain ATCC 15261 / DSM 4724 / KCTC 12464 / NCIMB 9791 / VKM B-1370 / CB 48) TaxID=573065 RepID=E8RSA5_ASTEC|nr:dienelactone hydrolase family protein [Asticcacaulis excentricus]ADU14376.1 Carboxymethylenebutenolidase [Asticcacaulis excentricus CB 48]
MDKPVVTQAMIDAYDEFTHTSFDRRAFMSRLTALTGSAAAAAAVLPLLSAGQAAAQTIAADDSRLVTEEVTIEGLKAYLARPKAVSRRLPSVLVIHENRGLTPHIRNVTRKLALEGFVALGADFLSPVGGTPANEDEARTLIGKLDGTQTVANAETYLNWLSGYSNGNGKTGAMGFCWGGGLVNRIATQSKALDAGVAYYGSQAPLTDVPGIQAPLMLHYASLDERINAGIEAYRAALTAAGKRFEIHMYEGVNHAFNNDTSPARYNKAAADLAWQRTVGFFKKYFD